jgi:hypothetical protein
VPWDSSESDMGAAVPSFPAQAEMADLPGFRPELGAKARIFLQEKIARDRVSAGNSARQS